MICIESKQAFGKLSRILLLLLVLTLLFLFSLIPFGFAQQSNYSLNQTFNQTDIISPSPLVFNSSLNDSSLNGSLLNTSLNSLNDSLLSNSQNNLSSNASELFEEHIPLENLTQENSTATFISSNSSLNSSSYSSSFNLSSDYFYQTRFGEFKIDISSGKLFSFSVDDSLNLQVKLASDLGSSQTLILTSPVPLSDQSIIYTSNTLLSPISLPYSLSDDHMHLTLSLALFDNLLLPSQNSISLKGNLIPDLYSSNISFLNNSLLSDSSFNGSSLNNSLASGSSLGISLDKQIFEFGEKISLNVFPKDARAFLYLTNPLGDVRLLQSSNFSLYEEGLYTLDASIYSGDHSLNTQLYFDVVPKLSLLPPLFPFLYDQMVLDSNLSLINSSFISSFNGSFNLSNNLSFNSSLNSSLNSSFNVSFNSSQFVLYQTTIRNAYVLNSSDNISDSFGSNSSLSSFTVEQYVPEEFASLVDEIKTLEFDLTFELLPSLDVNIFSTTVVSTKKDLFLEKKIELENELGHTFKGKLLFDNSDMTSSVKSIEFSDLYVKNNTISLGVKDVQGSNDAFVNRAIKTYAIDPEQLNFSSAIVTVNATGNELYKCKDWNYANNVCEGDWELFKTGLEPGQEYTFELTAHDPAFAEQLVDQNSFVIPAGSLTQSHTIDEVNLSKSFVLCKTANNVNSGTEPDVFTAICRFENSTSIIAERYQSDDNITMSYQVVESENIHVQKGSVTMPSGSTTVNVDFATPVNLSKSLVVFSQRLNAGSTADTERLYHTGEFLDSDTLTFTRGQSGSEAQIEFFVIEFLDGTTVQTGELSSWDLESVTDNRDSLVSSVNTSLSWMTYSYSVTNGGLSRTSITGELENSTSVHFWKESSSAGANTGVVRWYVVSFPENLNASVQRGIYSTSSTSDYSVNVSVNPVDLDRSFSYFGHATCTGSGNAYPRPQWINYLSNESTLHLQRGYYGQSSDIAWQVVSLPEYRQGLYWNQTGLDLGEKIISQGNITGNMSFISTGENTQPQVQCVAGDCASITHSVFLPSTFHHGDSYLVDFNCENTSLGFFSAIFNVSSDESYEEDSLNVSCTFNPEIYVEWNSSELNESVFEGSGIQNFSTTIHSTGDNTGINISCSSGNCNTITTTWTNDSSLLSGQSSEVNFSCDTSTKGTYSAKFDLVSNENSLSKILKVNCEILDITPPGTLTSLNESEVSYTWIVWKWNNPSDSDFNHTMVFVNGTFYANITSPQILLNISGLELGTQYEIETRTVDDNGNINLTWVNDTASTLVNEAPTIQLHSPLNKTFGEELFRTLNVTVYDEENDSLCVSIYGSNSTSFDEENDLIYFNCSAQNGSNILYNFSNTLDKKTPDSEIIWHFNNDSRYLESNTLVHNFINTAQDHDLECSGSSCPIFVNNTKFVGAFSYDGVDDNWFLDESYFNDAFSQKSFSFWIKPSTTSGIRPIYEEGGSTNGLALIINDSLLEYATRTGSVQHTIQTPFTETTSWHKVTITYDLGNMSLYLDANLVNSTDTSADYTTISSHGNDGSLGSLYSSSAFGSISGFYEGLIDEVHISNGVFSPLEVSSHFFEDTKTYYWKVVVEDLFHQENLSNLQFTILNTDLNVTITSPTPSGNDYDLSTILPINANVSEAKPPLLNISYVKVVVDFPDGSSQEYLMNNVSSTNYTYNFSDSNQLGRYNFTIIAENTAGVINDTQTSWFNISHTSGAAILCENSPCVANSSLIMSVDSSSGTPEPNQPNTIDACTDGTSGTYLTDENIENITITNLNGSVFRGGDTVEINVTAHCYDATSDNINFVYANDSLVGTLPWRVIYSVDPCPAVGFNSFSTQFVLDDTKTNQAFRGIIQYNGNVADTCGTGSYDDNDDVEFVVKKPREFDPPLVNILSPANETVYDYGNTVNISVNVTDVSNIENVSVFIDAGVNNWTIPLSDVDLDGIYTGSFSQTIYETNYTMTVLAEDEFGNINNSEWIVFSVNDTSNLDVVGLNCTPQIVDQLWETTCYANISDSVDGVDSVWAKIMYPNSTSYDVLSSAIFNTSSNYNFTFNQTHLLGNYTVEWFANNSLSEEREDDLITFEVVPYDGLETTLVTPINNYKNYSSLVVDVDFNCSAIDEYGLKNISLYITNSTNSSSSFTLNQTSLVSGLQNDTQWTLSLETGNYTWNCLSYNQLGNYDWANNNRTLRIDYDTQDPVVELINPLNGSSLQSLGELHFKTNVTDNLALQNCTLWTNLSGTWEANESKIISGSSQNVSWILQNLSNGNYIWNAYCCDTVDNCAWDEVGGINGNNTFNYTLQHLPIVENILLNSSLNKNQTTENLSVWYNVTDQDISDAGNLSGVVDWFINNNSYYVLNIPFTRSSNDTYSREYSHNLSAIGTNVTFNYSGTTDKTVGHTDFGSYSFTGVDGDGSILTVEDDPSNKFIPADNFTFMAWVKFRSVDNGFHVILEKGYSSNFLFGIATYNSVFMAAVDSTPRTGSATETDCQGTFDVSSHLNEWHHLAATYDKENIKVYVDGVLDATCAETSPLNLVNNKWGLGSEYDPGQPDNTNWESDAEMSEFFVLKKAMSSAQIARFYEGNYNTIMFSDTRSDETWKACVTPNDGRYDGALTCSNELSVIEYLDEWPPVVSLENPVNYTNETVSNNPLFYFNVSDEHAQNLTCRLNITDLSTNISSFRAINTSVHNGTSTNISATTVFTNGLYNWSILCDDGQNNASSEIRLINISIIDDVAPKVNAISPANNTVYTSTFNPEFSYNVTDNQATLLTCNLEIYDVDLGSSFLAGEKLTSINVSTNITTNVSLANGNYSWLVNCSDGQNTNISQERNFTINYIDSIAPQIMLISQGNNSIEYAGVNENYTFKVIDDDTRESANVDCTVYREYTTNGTVGSYGTLHDIELNTSVSLVATEDYTAKTKWWVNCTDDSGNQNKSSEEWFFNYYQTVWLDDMEPGKDAYSGNWNETYTTNLETYGIEGPVGNIYGGDYVYADSPNSEYEIASTEMHLTTPSINLSGYGSANVSFFHTYDLLMNGGDCQDAMIIEISTDGSNYSPITPQVGSYLTINDAANPRNGDSGFCGTQNWTQEFLNLTPYVGNETVYLRWTLATNDADSADGYNLDNIVLDGVFETNPPLVTIFSPSNLESFAEHSDVEILVNVTDDTSVDLVYANISWNGGLDYEYISLPLLSGSTYGINFTNTSWAGNYTVHIIARDIFNNINDTQSVLFEIVPDESWHTLYGLLDYDLLLGNSANDLMKNWTVFKKIGNIFFSDVDAQYNISDLQPLNESGDLSQADAALGLHSPYGVVDYYDSDLNGFSDLTSTFVIDDSSVYDVPIMNSTNTSSFVTGILWDGADGGSEYDGSQDLVFVTRLNASQVGSYGTYDYEISVPSALQSLIGSNNQVSERWELS